ncbi:MAG: cyclopropane-fatty-acyl-phospholipid synthase family protein [Candidatus Sericytochromatia bacterium]|nr:cyclopropane-fatty-acyl-phospholipid synthase family protein [Candidatus Sericytochromatia bacterium]
MPLLDTLLAAGVVPDGVIRIGIRRLLRERLASLPLDAGEATEGHVRRFFEACSQGPIAVQTRAANEQHYEVPTAYFQHVLGPHLKYSSGWWDLSREQDLVADQARSEADMLALTCERAGLADGQAILELGCGWGSLTLWMAERYPGARILAVSNSATQRAHIEATAHARGLTNLEVRTADMNAFQPEGRFDRVVSVEMMEHMRNHRALLQRITGWLKPGGRIFVHIFTHRQVPYMFEAVDEHDWMGRYFFSGGMMPSADVFSRFPEVVRVAQQWEVDGRHYARTAEAWLQRQDRARASIWPIFEQAYGPGQARRWWSYWRIFYMACAELFAWNNGQEWFVSHYLLEPAAAGVTGGASGTASATP